MFRETYFNRWRKRDTCKCTHPQWLHVGHIERCQGCACEHFEIVKRSKYNAVRSTFEGTAYDSKLERRFAEDLEMRKKAGDIKSYKPHVTIPLIVNDQKICDYEVDFQVEHNDGTTEYVEVKGMFLPLGKFKWRLFEALMSKTPNVKLRLVRQ